MLPLFSAAISDMIRCKSFCKIAKATELGEAAVLARAFVIDEPKAVDNPSALVTPVGGVARAGAPPALVPASRAEGGGVALNGPVEAATFAPRFWLRLAAAFPARFWLKLPGVAGVVCKADSATAPVFALKAAMRPSACSMLFCKTARVE